VSVLTWLSLATTSRARRLASNLNVHVQERFKAVTTGIRLNIRARLPGALGDAGYLEALATNRHKCLLHGVLPLEEGALRIPLVLLAYKPMLRHGLASVL
jgi:hypothetical protein